MIWIEIRLDVPVHNSHLDKSRFPLPYKYGRSFLITVAIILIGPIDHIKKCFTSTASEGSEEEKMNKPLVPPGRSSSSFVVIVQAQACEYVIDSIITSALSVLIQKLN
jgi:hypothetical protein